MQIEVIYQGGNDGAFYLSLTRLSPVRVDLHDVDSIKVLKGPLKRFLYWPSCGETASLVS